MKNNIHSHYLTVIKRLLQASFVGWVREEDKKYLQINIDNQKFSIAFDGDQITENDYTQLIQNILEYGRKVQESVPNTALE
jgi:hypothetical protein